MRLRILKLVSTGLASGRKQSVLPHVFSVNDVTWAMGSFCALNGKPFDCDLLLQQFPPPYSADSIIHAGRALGFKIKRNDCESGALAALHLPCLAIMHDPEVDNQLSDASAQAANDADIEPAARTSRPAIIVQINDGDVILFEAGSNTPKTLTQAEFGASYAGTVFQLALNAKIIKDPDGAQAAQSKFGFNWFIPELLKHRRVWRDVLIASLIIAYSTQTGHLFQRKLDTCSKPNWTSWA